MRRRLLCVVALATLAAQSACGGGGGRGGAVNKRVGTTTTTEAASSTTSTVPANLDAVSVTLTKVADVTQTTAFAVRPKDPTLYVAQQQGQIVGVRDGQVAPVLDISNKTLCCGEQGLLGIVFSRDGNRLYVHSTRLDGDSRVEEYTFASTPGGGGTADPASARVVLTAPGLQPNHNGGQLALGPDGMLYIGLGDGGAGGDQGTGHAPGGNGQSVETLLGKILRIDPTPGGGREYQIPPGNPYANGGGRPEIWAYGLRNPWRFSFDPPSKTIWIADVGQDAWEEIDVAPADTPGINYGWDVFEGNARFRDGNAPGARPPIIVLSHNDGYCAVIGGYVYRGKKIPDLVGSYLYSDNCKGDIRALRVDTGGKVHDRSLGVELNQISSFGQGNDGALYVLSQSDGLFRIDPA